MNSITKLINAYHNLKNWTDYKFKKKQIRESSVTFTTKGFPVSFEVINDNYPIFKEIFVEDFYEINKVLKHTPVNPVIVDIGANVGFFCYMILSKRPDSKIYAFDPLQTNCLRLRDTILQNKIEKSISVFKEAVTDVHGDKIKLYFKKTEEESSIASIYEKFDSRNENFIEVETTNLEQIFIRNKINTIDILKMDCEGAEYSILYNAPAKLFKSINIILLEVHNLDDDKMNNVALYKFLEEKGFSILAKEFQNGCYYFFAKNNDFKNA